MFDGLISSVNLAAPQVETAFNIAGSIPIFGSLGSIGRIVAAIIQTLAGFYFALFAAIGYLGAIIVDEDAQTKRSFARLFQFGVQHLGHGALNITRGCLELVGQAIFGMPTIAFNLSKNPQFSPVVYY